MKLLEFRCIKSKNEEEVGNIEYFIELECDEERACYEWAHRLMHDERIVRECRAYYDGYWDCYMTERLDNDMSEGQVFYYFTERCEEVPKVGETFMLDDMVFERVE